MEPGQSLPSAAVQKPVCCCCRVMWDGAVGQLGSKTLVWLRISDARGIFLDVFSNNVIQILLVLGKGLQFMQAEVQL